MASEEPIDLQIAPKQSCSTCVWWEHLRRGKTCRANRKPKGSTKPGTPADYWCNEYKPLTGARCSECKFWTDERAPRKKAPCSELGLLDGKGKDRTGRSLHCPIFSQKNQVTVVDNPSVRVDGTLASVVDLGSHSEARSVLLRTDDQSGFLCKWVPAGPGKGEWHTAPVSLTADEAGNITVVGYSASPRDRQGALFAGNVTVKDQTFRGQNNTERGQGIPAVKFGVVSNVRRRGTANVATETVETEAVGSIQDEPWGSDWEDLREQMINLVGAGKAPSEAATRVRARYEKDTGKKLGPNSGRRLEAQLQVEARDV